MSSKAKGKAAKIVLVTFGVLILGSAGTVSALAAKYRPVIAPGTTIAGVEIGGLSKEEAVTKISDWWSSVENRRLQLHADGLTAQPTGFTPGRLGVSIDAVASVDKVSLEDFWASSTRKLTGGTSSAGGHDSAPVLKVDEKSFEELSKFVDENLPPHSKAKVDLEDGKIVRTYEQAGLGLDAPAALDAVLSGVMDNREVNLPLIKGKPRISDEELDKITEVVSTFTSHFNEGNANRSSNIKNAASRLTGTVLMPGERFSFNKTLGQRTAKNGFKLAGVYNNGKHDFDIGGGICQVSTTLYNATLLANLKIVQRSCHTFPVPYVPVGRDATVSFPAPDFEFENSFDHPIAIAVKAGGGSITFSVLGIKDPGMSVKLETAGHSSWSRPEKVINDPSLPPGKRVVEEPGGAGHRITTYRVVYRDGKEINREDLGTSIYNGGQRVVRMNLSSHKAPATEVPGKPVDDESPDGAPPQDAGGGTIPPD